MKLAISKTLKVDAKNWQPPEVSTETTVRMQITPKLAERILDALNTNNRPVSPKKVHRIAEKMKSGRWTYTHQGIGFSKIGKLMDGQHRLHALIIAGVTLEFPVTFGMDPNVFPDIDEPGMTRTAGDLLKIRRPEAKHAKLLCAIARAMLMGMDGKYPERELVAEFTDWYYEMLLILVEAFIKQPAWSRPAPVIAAFGNAARGIDEWTGGHGSRDPELVVLLAMRYGSMEWEGNHDPLKLLYQRISRMRTASGELTRSELYSYATAAVRLALQGKTSSKTQQSSVEWGAPQDYGKMPRIKTFTGKSRTKAKKAEKAEKTEKANEAA